MKVEELIVGDLVRVAKNVCIPKGTIVTIRGIDMDNSFEEMNLRGCATCLPINDRYRMTGCVWVEYLEPISLTPEILEKNGFKPQIPQNHIETVYACQDVSKAVAAELYALWPYLDGSFYLLLRVDGKDMVRMDVHYIHQLQHALRLCGIEKEIKL